MEAQIRTTEHLSTFVAKATMENIHNDMLYVGDLVDSLEIFGTVDRDVTFLPILAERLFVFRARDNMATFELYATRKLDYYALIVGDVINNTIFLLRVKDRNKLARMAYSI